MVLPVLSVPGEVIVASPGIAIGPDSMEFLTEMLSMLVWVASSGIESDSTEFLTEMLEVELSDGLTKWPKSGKYAKHDAVQSK